MPDAITTVDTDVLDEAECRRLLGRQTVGRVIFTDAAMPTAMPVAYALDHGEIVFRVQAGSALARATSHAVVAFEADDIDPHTLIGWSVVGIGRTYELTEPARLDELSTAGLVMWAPTGPAAIIGIRLERLTGHRLGPATR